MRSRSKALPRLIAATVLAVGMALPAAAQKAPAGNGGVSVTAPLRALLATIPADLVQPMREAPDIAFGDIEAARGLPQSALGDGDARFDPALLPVLRALPAGRFTEDPALISGGWAGRVGFDPIDLRALLTIDRAPLRMTVLRLDPAVAPRVGPALAASGYASRADRPGAWAVGEDFAIDFAARAQGDPFRGMLGAASRVAVDGDLLRHANGWPAFDILRAPGPATADAAPTLVPLLEAMDRLDAGALLRAVILPNAAGLSLQDPMAVIQGRAPPAPSVVWLSAVIADFAQGDRVTGALILATPALPDPEAVRAAVLTRWAEPGLFLDGRRSFAEAVGATPAVTVANLGGMAVMILALEMPAGHQRHIGENSAFRLFLNATYQRSMGFLP
ncbi:MAG: hypothetical protein H6898_08665 [Rhodobacter sp.]|nr:hypothetical protein [Paracoccaceae bacterium]MCC0076647.1 hypothetical protein [Rhodobacter sp.]